MGIRGLFTYIGHNPDNFAPFELHNTRLVVDAENFINHLYRRSGLAMLYAGEYMDYTLCVRIFLKQLRKCLITPLFVFDGCHSREGAKHDTLVKRSRERIDALSKFLNNTISLCADVDSLPSVPEILPKLTNQTFIQVLNEYRVPHVTCENEADMHIAELAMYLDCPVLSNDSDFYLFQSPGCRSVYRVIPLVSLEPDPKRQRFVCAQCNAQSRDRCYAMRCSIFIPNRSSLNIVHPSLLPLLAVMIGNDVISAVRLPPAIDQILATTNTPGMPYYMRRIHSIVTWLSRFGTNIQACVRELLLLYTHDELDQLSQQIIHCVLGYLLNPDVTGPYLSSALGISISGLRQLSKQPAASSKPATLTQDPLNTTVAKVCDVLTGSITPQNDDGLLNTWPPIFKDCFRRNLIGTSILDAIYVQGGTVLRVLFEDFHIQRSIYVATEPIRRLTYALWVSVQQELGNGDRLWGLKDDHPVENRRHGCDMLSFTVGITPRLASSMSCTQEFLNSFFLEHLNMDLTKFQNLPRYHVVLASVLILWSRNSLMQPIAPMRHNSVAIAFLCCVLVTLEHVFDVLDQVNKLELVVADLCEHYATVSGAAKQACCASSNSMFAYFHIPVVHQLNELQLHYLELKYLVQLLVMIQSYRARQPRVSSPLEFLPCWIMFPSGRLLYWLAQALEMLAPSARYAHLTSYWLPQLLAIFGHNRPTYIERVTIQLESLVKQIESAW